MVLFLAVVTGVVVFAHVYVYRRLVRDVFVESRWRRAGALAVGALGLGMVLGVPLSRLLPRATGVEVGYWAFAWMGTMALVLMILFTADLLRLPLSIRRKRRGQPLPDPGRRIALSRGIAAVTTLGAAGGAAAALREGAAEPVISEVEVPLGVPAALKGLRIVQVSDIHVGPTIGRGFIERLVARINALEPDVVAITGDLVDGTVARLGHHTAPLGDIESRHGTFFCTGNHEYYSGADAWIAELSRLGVRVLRNERVTLDHDGAALDLLGIDDWRADRFPGHGADLARAVAGRDPQTPSVLLAHQPRAVSEAAELGVDLVLSGHTHGGQIWPLGAFVKLVQPYVRGLHLHRDRTWIYVHPGTGYWGPPMRLNTPAEIAVITLT